MSSTTIYTPQATSSSPYLSVIVEEPELMTSTSFLAIAAATVDLVKVAGLITGQRRVASGSAIAVRKAHYGSPFEVDFQMIATTTASLLALAGSAALVMDRLAASPIKLATARKIDAQTHEIIRQSRQFARESERAEAVLRDPLAIDLVHLQYDPSAESHERMYQVVSADGVIYTFDLAEVQLLIVAQADARITNEIKTLLRSTKGRGSGARFTELDARTLSSLLILSGHLGEVRVKDEDEM